MINLETHLKLMFEESLHSDLCLSFRHPKYPLELSFHVHKSILSQSSFFNKLITQDNKLAIDLTKEWTRCGFNNYEGRMTKEQLNLYIQNMLKWFYCIKKEDGLISDTNVLDILSLAILFDISPLYNECVDRYICILDMDCIMRDVDFICQFPRKHPVYIKLLDHMFVILLRSSNPVKLAQLPVDYLARILSNDLLFVSNEFARYRLMKSVFCVVDPDSPLLREKNKKTSDVLPFLDKHLVMTTSEARFQKRKRVQYEGTWNKAGIKRRKLEFGGVSKTFEEEDEYSDNDDENNTINDNGRGHEKKSMNKGSLNDILENICRVEKPNALIKLLKTTIYYSNMTFKQLSIVREDRIVDEDIIFRALWERETLERLIDPTSYNLMLSQPPSTDNVITTLEKNDKERILPRFRFSTTILVTSPKKNQDEWECEVIPCEDDNNKSTKIFRQSFYSNPEKLPYQSYIVEVRAEVIILCNNEHSTNQKDTQHQLNCKFRLKPVNDCTQATPSLSMITQANYWIYCFNKHEKGEERRTHEISKAVTVQESNEVHSHQVVVPTDLKETLRIDVSVVGEVLDV